MSKEFNLLACDLGTSNGRLIMGKYDGDRVKLQTIYKFPNGGERIHDNLYWNIVHLFSEIKNGLRKAAGNGDSFKSIGVDTWGVDYGLLDKGGNLLSFPYHYRDHRTDGVMEEVFKKISRKEIYQKTGNQFLQFNTLFQLYIDKRERPWILENTDSLLFMPDLINYFFTGEKYNEYTIASTSQLFNPQNDKWSSYIFSKLNLPKGIMQRIIEPGDKVGELLGGVKRECGLQDNLDIIAVASHDTASAVAGTPLSNRNDSVYISSGTWSLLGMELKQPLINELSLQQNFTNELGVSRRVRFLKNITGLWLIQECKRLWEKEEGRDLSYDDISQAAERAEPFLFKLDVDDPVFLNPTNMIETIRDYCRQSGQKVPESVGQISRGLYESLAFSYDRHIKTLEKLSGKEIKTIHVVGGGSQSEILCQITASISGRRVIAGPVEATAMGNIIAQLMAAGEIKDLEEGREVIKHSVELKEYDPE